MENIVLEKFQAGLLQAFYERKSVDGADSIKEDMFPDPRFQHLKPFAWDEEYPNFRVKIHQEVEDDDILTVDELISKLKEYSGDLFVVSEGCDCTGNVDGIMFDEGDKFIFLTRSNR